MMHLTADKLGTPKHKPALVKRPWKRRALALVLLAVAVAFGPEVVRVTRGSNFHTVIDGRFYRAAQPNGATLEDYIRAYGMRTVINLRGPNDGEDWFEEEKLAAQRHGVAFVSVNMSASDKPQEQELRKLIQTFENCSEPILVHCNSGSDRSGFASACYLLLKTGVPLDEARAQLSLRFGHFPWGKAGCQNEVFDQYKSWLDARGREHSPDQFRRWAVEFYQKDDWPAKNGK
jgi:protein tyrosine/serine phosphatase